jgi:hypothetical protein
MYPLSSPLTLDAYDPNSGGQSNYNVNNYNNNYNQAQGGSNDINNPNQQSALGGLGGAAAQAMRNLYNFIVIEIEYLEKSGLLETKPEVLSVKVPNQLHGCYKRIFNRKTPRESYPIKCKACGQHVNTQVKSEIGIGNVGCCIISCLTCPTCFWCPFVIDDCYDHSHKCPSCQAVAEKEKFLLG